MAGKGTQDRMQDAVSLRARNGPGVAPTIGTFGAKFNSGRNHMGQIVAAMATVHAPQLFTRPPEEDPKQLDASIAAMRKLGQVLDETRAEALVIFASDHMETFFLHSVPTFCVIAGDRGPHLPARPGSLRFTRP
jgi:hypothetical protein